MEELFVKLNEYGITADLGMNILKAVAILIIGRIFVGILSGVVRRILARNKTDETLAKFLVSLTKIALMTFVIVAAISALEVETTSFVAVIGAAGLAIKKVIVPNSKITSDSITNYSAMERRRIDFVFGIGYDDDIKKAKTTLEKIVSEDDRILKDPAPTVAVSELGDSSINFVVRPWVKTSDYWPVYFAITEKVKLTFDQEGISIPFPQSDVHLFQAAKAS
jgi:small conductance mechanosensitive channel